MKLGEFLTNVPKSTAKKEPVKFTLIGRSKDTVEQFEVEGFAAWSLVTDKDHEAADLAAFKALVEKQKDLGGIVPSDLLEKLERVHFLAVALRDYDSPIERFADADTLQRHVARHELKDLEREYHAWAEKNYPSRITKEDRDELKGEARGK